MLTIIVICHVCIAPLSQRLAANFACVTVQETVYRDGQIWQDQRAYLAQDPSLACYWADTVGLGLIMMALVAAIPGAFVITMRHE